MGCSCEKNNFLGSKKMFSQCRGKETGQRGALRRCNALSAPPTLRRTRRHPTLRRLRRCDAATLPATPDAATPPTLRCCDAPDEAPTLRRLGRCDAATLPANPRRCDASPTLRRSRRTPDAATPRCDAATLPSNPRRCDASDAATLRRSRRNPDTATPPTLRRLRRCDASDAATLRRCDAPGDPPTLRRLRRCDAATLPANPRRCDASDAATLRCSRRTPALRRFRVGRAGAGGRSFFSRERLSEGFF